MALLPPQISKSPKIKRDTQEWQPRALYWHMNCSLICKITWKITWWTNIKEYKSTGFLDFVFHSVFWSLWNTTETGCLHPHMMPHTWPTTGTYFTSNIWVQATWLLGCKKIILTERHCLSATLLPTYAVRGGVAWSAQWFPTAEFFHRIKKSDEAKIN
jgi:hypothetical protein